LDTPASFGLDVPDDAGFARKTGSLRSRHPLTTGPWAPNPLKVLGPRWERSDPVFRALLTHLWVMACLGGLVGGRRG